MDATCNFAGPQSEDDAIAALLDQARSAVDPFVAITLYEKALQARPDDTSIMGDAAELMLQLGQTEQAKQVRVAPVRVVVEGHARIVVQDDTCIPRESVVHRNCGVI